MVLHCVINNHLEPRKVTERTYDDSDYGMYVTERGKLVIRTRDGKVYDMQGRELDIKDEKGFRCYFEGGTSNIKLVNMDEKGNEIMHPSYGVVTLTKSTVSPPQALYGSSIKHGNMIRMDIDHSELHIGNTHEWYHKNGTICSIEMSMTQFAEMISSVGNADGVPCTVIFTEEEGNIRYPNFVDKTKRFREDFNDETESIKNILNAAYKQIKDVFDSKKQPTKAEKEKVLNALKTAYMKTRENLPYASECFAKHTDSIIKEAKGEIEAFANSKYTEMLTALAKGEKVPEIDMVKPVELGITTDSEEE